MPPALCCSQLTSASPLHLLNKDQGTAGLRVSIPVQANVCMKHANGRSWGFSVLWAFPTPPNPPHAGGAALHSIAQSSAHPKTSLYPTEGKTEIKPEQPWHCQSRRAWGGWMPWSGHIPTPSTPSPCCGLCRRRPWLPGPAGRPCSRGSWGCSASPSPLLSPLPPAMHGRAAGTAQPQAQHSCKHSTAAGTARHGCPPPTCAWEAATLLRALPNPAARWDLSGPAAQQRRMHRSTGGESCKVEGGTSPLQNRNPRDCKTRSASIGCGWRRKCFSFLLEK